MSEADKTMTATLHASKTGFDAPGYTLGHSDVTLDNDIQLAMAISASLNEG